MTKENTSYNVNEPPSPPKPQLTSASSTKPKERHATPEEPQNLTKKKSIFIPVTLVILGVSCILCLMIGGVLGYLLRQYMEQTKTTSNQRAKSSIEVQLDNQKNIREIKENLKARWKETWAESEKIKQTLETLNEVPDVEVIWAARKFYGKEWVQRTESFMYTDYSDPNNPVKKTEQITFTLDHGTLFTPPSKVLVRKEDSTLFIMKAVAGKGSERTNSSGYLAKVSLYSISARNTKKAYLKKQQELEALMPEKIKEYEQAEAEAEQKIEAIKSGLISTNE